MNKLLDKQQVAELLGVSPRTINRYLAAGAKLGQVKVGKRLVRFRRRDVEKVAQKGLSL